VYRWGDTAAYLLKEHWNFNLVESTYWDYIKDNVSKEAWDWLWTDAITKHGLYRYGSIYKGMREFLDGIKEFCDIVVITSRPPSAAQDTMDWIAYQKLPTNEIRILGRQEKSSVQPQCDVYIDDAIHNCQDLIEHTKGLVIMPDHTWNQGYTPDEITRFHRTYSVEHMKFILETYHMQMNREGVLVGATN
jgi:uncharacterized HAD superfamily protein